MPPHVIAETWYPEELQNAEVLADLEAWGQAKRMVARLSAEIHNAAINQTHAIQSMKASVNIPVPKQLTEGSFLPKKVWKLRIAKSPTKTKKLVDSHQKRARSILDSLAGF